MTPLASDRPRRRPSPLLWAAAVLVLALGAGGSSACASHGRAPASSPAPEDAPAAGRAPHLAPSSTTGPAALAAPTTPGAALARELEQLLAAPALGTAVVGALVQSLDTGEVLYRLNPDTLLVPASNMKIVTTAVAGTRLGWDFRFETRLETTASVAGGVLAGDLFVTGTGDPTINRRGGDRLSTFRDWAARLKAAGVTRVAGRIIGDDDAFDDEQFGEGWSWDDFVFDYAAPVGALQFNENYVEIAVRPAAQVGGAATVEVRSPGADIVVAEAHVTTSPAGTRTDVSILRFPGRRDLRVRGSIALGSQEEVLRPAVDNPTIVLAAALRETLRAEGLAVDGEAVDIDAAEDVAALKATSGARRVLVRHQSPPLSEICKPLMKISQNLYAETVFRSLSLGPGPATVAASRERTWETLRSWGVAPGQVVVVDGSGLSRLNFLSASAIVRILRAMARDPQSFAAFEATFPIAGRDGSLTSRLRATRAEGNAVGKTGTLSNVRSLSGYVRTQDGERLAFSFLANNFTMPSSAVDAIVDQGVERLANFRR